MRIPVFLSLVIILTLSSCFKERRSNKAGHKMQDFIVEISDYAKGIDPDFAIIPQNGEELLFTDLDSESALDERLINAIDAIGIEEVFYNGGNYSPDDYRLQMLLKAKVRIPVLVADYLGNDADYNQAVQYNADAGFLAFPRVSSNYDYLQIPTTVTNENANDVLKLSDARNYLYLISDGGYSTKQDYLAAIQQTNFDVVIMDAFYGEDLYTSAEINALKTKLNGGKRMIIAYMSVGSAEKYRYYWQDDWKLHKPRWLKKEYDGYSEEIWVKFWKKEWKEIIYGNDDSYTKKLINVGFDGTYLDNVEAFYSLYFDE
ncbi:MAG: endo alpha-1,4 polygalactosaminidase [Fluviicola sp.]|nr:endo alpha-1,4 polygalactosaminidase [Fluviicola sp.]